MATWIAACLGAMKSATLVISLLKASLAVRTESLTFAGLALLTLTLSVCVAKISYDRAVEQKQLLEQWRQESLQYWKLKNALINIGIDDVMEIQDGLSEIRRPNGAVEYWRTP
jgi:hypothetical protein